MLGLKNERNLSFQDERQISVVCHMGKSAIAAVRLQIFYLKNRLETKFSSVISLFGAVSSPFYNFAISNFTKNFTFFFEIMEPDRRDKKFLIRLLSFGEHTERIF